MAIILVLALAFGLAAGLFLIPRNRTAEYYFESGEKAFEKGEYSEAVKLYKQGIKLAPDSSVGYNLLGMAYRYGYDQLGSRSLKQEEEDAFRKSVELAPTNAVALVNLGATLFYEGRKSEAVVYLRRALEAQPDHPDRAAIEEMIRQAEQSP